MIPIIDLNRQYRAIQGEVETAMREVLERGDFVLGKALHRFEEEMASYCGVKHAIGVNSGTDAIYLALLGLGVGPGDDVVTTAFSMFATVEPIRLLGARPVFVDIDPEHFHVDLNQLRSKVTKKTKAIIPVHLYGSVAPMKEIMELARQRNVPVLEDAAQAIGATYGGKKAGSLGTMGCVSFYPTKNLGGYGDGGMVLTSDDKLAEAVRTLRHHGQTKKYVHQFIGINSRLDDLQAAVLSVKLKYLDGWNARRRDIAAKYAEGFKSFPIRIPVEPADVKHIYHQYTMRVADRDDVQRRLGEAGISSAVHYPLPLPYQPALETLGYQRGDFPESEKAANEVLSLPIFPEMTSEEVELVVKGVNQLVMTAAGR